MPARWMRNKGQGAHMMTPFRLTAALVALASPVLAEGDIAVMSYGGAFSQAQEAAYNAPFTAGTGIGVTMVDADNPVTPIRTMVEAGAVTIDAAMLDSSDALRLCDEGVLAPIDPAALPPAPDGTPAAQDFLPGGLGPCFVAADVYATAIGYDRRAFGDTPPAALRDFFDLETFPGKRGLLKDARFTLELALMGDGVPADQVYALLASEAGRARAFARLDSIRDQVIWWEAGAQPPQLLADGEVSMSATYSGRIFNAVIEENMPFGLIWDGQIYVMEGWVIPRGAPHPAQALDYIAFASSTESQARMTQHISYGPARVSSAALVGLYQDGKTPMAPHLPTSPENMTNALPFGTDFWADHDGELVEAFNAWLAGG